MCYEIVLRDKRYTKPCQYLVEICSSPHVQGWCDKARAAIGTTLLFFSDFHGSISGPRVGSGTFPNLAGLASRVGSGGVQNIMSRGGSNHARAFSRKILIFDACGRGGSNG